MTCSCQSNEERYQWVSKITSAIPKSKETAEKKEKQAEETIKTEPTSQEDDKDKSTSTENLQGQPSKNTIYVLSSLIAYFTIMALF